MEWTNPLIFFVDPILRAPTLGSMLMCLAAGLVGTLVFLRKQSLLGEALSHASYPGVILGVMVMGTFFKQEAEEFWLPLFILVGASLTALLGLGAIRFLERRLRVHSDAALCFVLSSFFGIGLTLASEVQFSHTNLYKQVQVYFYGQAATMTNIHILIYGILAFVTIMMVMAFYKELQVMTFDHTFAKSIGISTYWIDVLLFILVVLAIIIGIRSVGVILMSAMLIAPAVAARQFTNRLSTMFILSAFFGVMSGFLGNYLSVELSRLFSQDLAMNRIALPTGPMIVLVAATITIGALFFAPERGVFVRFLRIVRFRDRCLSENILKAIWRHDPHRPIHLNDLSPYQSISKLYLRWLLRRLVVNGWLKKIDYKTYQLTEDGRHRAMKIIRFHRLWEVYLVDYLGVGAERVHRNAEEMEHIITPELEEELMLLLRDPKVDPHHQPIPPKE